MPYLQFRILKLNKTLMSFRSIVASSNRRPAAMLAATLLLAASCAAPETQPPPPSEPVAAAPDSSTMRPDPRRPVGGNMATPPYWKVRLDEPDAAVRIGADDKEDDIYFVSMTPGWHITTGPASIFYHPANTAAGAFTAHTTIHLFDPGDRNEAFGLFVGGMDLEGANQTYDYFLIRNSGEFLIKRRIGSETQLVQDWAPSPAIQRYTDPAVSSVQNKMSIRVEGAEVVFSINEVEVARLPSAEGIVGIRVNHGLNLHVSELAVEPVG
jgi:hypothetical protein